MNDCGVSLTVQTYRHFQKCTAERHIPKAMAELIAPNVEQYQARS